MFQRGKRSGGGHGEKKFGGNSYGKRGFGGDRGYRDGARPMMNKAICDECGKPCEVPFKPSGDRPVYCNNCFKKGDNGGPRPERDSRKSSGVGHGISQEQFETLNAKLDEILEALTGIAEDEDEDDDEET